MTDPNKPSYSLEFAPAAERDLKRLDLNIRRRIVSDLEKLQQDPRPHGVETLETKEWLLRVRVGPGQNYRAIYQVQDAKLIVLVLKVGDRKEVYRGLK